MDKIPKIGFTIGDVNGIGIEVLLKALSDNRILKLCTPIIYGSNRLISFFKKMLEIDSFSYSSIHSPYEAGNKQVNIINCIVEEIKIEPGYQTVEGGHAALTSLEAATNDLIENKIDAMVTGPISKKNMQQEGFGFPGHTEYLNFKAGNKQSVMMLMHEALKVCLVTNHIPVKDIEASITTDLIINKLKIIHNTLLQDFAFTKPKIAVLGLNPHTGDGGLLGNEESTKILPAIEAAQKENIIAIGPFSADGLFGSGNFHQFDAILAMYHDQGLVPFKTLSFGNGVNLTAGLRFIRTSPDHGTAFSIAGKNLANPSSMLQAIFSAIDIVRNRDAYKEATKNPLKRTAMASE